MDALTCASEMEPELGGGNVLGKFSPQKSDLFGPDPRGARKIDLSRESFWDRRSMFRLRRSTSRPRRSIV
eukprot:1948744-Alexandrium_andersonii.AAC.1